MSLETKTSFHIFPTKVWGDISSIFFDAVPHSKVTITIFNPDIFWSEIAWETQV